MSLELCEIYFDHDRLPDSRRPVGSSPLTSSLHIRRSQDFEVDWPEYKKSNLNEISESKVAYSITGTAGQAVFILVEFANHSSANTTYEVRADGGGVLGPLNPTPITFSAEATSVKICFPLSGRAFEEIGKFIVTWNWYYREPGSSDWQDLATTVHQVFLTFAAPEQPWSSAAYNQHNPWTDLLEICCEIAQGAQDDITAVAQITRAINSRYNIRYDIIAGAPRYVYTIDNKNQPVSMFDIVSWMDFVLNGKAPSELLFLPGTQEEHKHYLIVGCQDTATALAIMSTIIGVKAELAYHTHFGYLQYVQPIGRGKCNSPYSYLNPRQPTSPVKGEDEERTKFQFHYYVKSGSRTFDSCMKEWTDNPQKEGWLVNLSQPEYEERVIDRSTARKKEMNGYLASDGTWHPSTPEQTDLYILRSG